MGSPDGSSGQCVSITIDQNEQEESDPHRSIHAAAVISLSLI